MRTSGFSPGSSTTQKSLLKSRYNDPGSTNTATNTAATNNNSSNKNNNKNSSNNKQKQLVEPGGHSDPAPGTFKRLLMRGPRTGVQRWRPGEAAPPVEGGGTTAGPCPHLGHTFPGSAGAAALAKRRSSSSRGGQTSSRCCCFLRFVQKTPKPLQNKTRL